MSTPVPHMRVELFGKPKLVRANSDLHLSPHQWAFLSIVLSEHMVSRGRIASILWQENLDSRIRQRIRQLRHAINRRAGAPMINAETDDLIANDTIASDLNEYRLLVRSGRLSEAATDIEDGFLNYPFVGVHDSFLDWKETFEQQLKTCLWNEARAKSASSMSRGDWRSARDAAETLYQLRPDLPDVVANLIEARARVGKLHAAELAYAQYREAHAQALSPDVEDMIARVRAVQSDDNSHDLAPFVGRSEALAGFKSVLGDILSGRSSFALITGEAGIGKTRFLSELRRLAQLEGIRALSAAPVELERRISLNPVIDALSSIDIEPFLLELGEPWRSVVGAMFPSGSSGTGSRELPPLDERGLSRRLMDAFSFLFRDLAADKPTILFIDDLHWADSTTLAALRFYQRRYAYTRFGVVATIRPDAIVEHEMPTFDTGGPPSPYRVHLGELEIEEADELVRQIGKGDIDEDTTQRLFKLAGRHPLYLTELVRDFLAGRLQLPSSTDAVVNIPISIQQILAARTRGLSEISQKLTSVLAVVAKPIKLGDLSHLTEKSIDETTDAVEELRNRRLVDFDCDRVWIVHDLFKRALYDELSDVRRNVLHLRVAEYMHHTRGRHASGELAHHYDRAGEPQLSAQHGWVAGERALARGAIGEAAHFFDLVARNENDLAKRAHATARLGMSLHLCRDMNRATPVLELAATRLRNAGLAVEARRMEVRRVEALAEAGATSVEELLSRLGLIRDEARRSHDWVAVALALDVELQLLLLDERLGGVRALYREFRRVVSSESIEAAAIAHRGLALGLMLEEPEGALLSAKEAVHFAGNLAPEHRFTALNRLLIVLLQQGSLHLPANRETILEARDLAQRSGDLLQRFSYESNIGVSFMDAGDLDRAEIHFDRARELLGSAEMTFPRINLSFNSGELALVKGDHHEAEEHFKAASRHPSLTVPRYTQDLVNAGLGLCALEAGSIGDARAREQQLNTSPSTWYYDPTIILAFRSRLAELRSGYRVAIEMLETANQGLEGRLVMAWLKVQLLQTRLLVKHADPRALHAARKGLTVSQQLYLPIRQRQFEYLVAKLP